jgi:hypothetical protein
MSTVMDTAGNKGRNLTECCGSAADRRRCWCSQVTRLYAYHQGGSPGRCQHGASTLQVNSQKLANQGREACRLASPTRSPAFRGHQGADRQRHQVAQRSLRPDRRRGRPDQDVTPTPGRRLGKSADQADRQRTGPCCGLASKADSFTQRVPQLQGAA